MNQYSATQELKETMAEAKGDKIAKLKSDEQAQTMLQIFVSQLFEHKLAVAGLGVIVFFVLVALCAPIIGDILNVDATSQNVFNRYKPPMTEVIITSSDQEVAIENALLRNPGIAELLGPQLKALPTFDTNISNEDAIYSLVELGNNPEAIKALKQLPKSDAQTEFLSMFRGFQRTHLLGTDELGRDVLMRLIYGARVSIGVGLLVAFASALIGLIIGCLAGFYGGWVDSILSRITDSMLALPTLPLLIIFAAVDLNKVPLLGDLFEGGAESIFKLVLVVCLFSWMPVARLVRGSTLALKEREFILAAKTLGSKNGLIMLTHVVPNVLAPLLVAVTLGVGETILWEAALSFLGLGIQPPTPSWGNILFNAQELIHAAPLLAILPGVLIFVTVISFNFLGDGIQDAIDPKAIRR